MSCKSDIKFWSENGERLRWATIMIYEIAWIRFYAILDY